MPFDRQLLAFRVPSMRRFIASSLPPRTLCAQAVLVMAMSVPTLVMAQTKGQPRPTRADEQKEPTTIQAEQMTGRPDREVHLDREVEIVRGQTKIQSDRAKYFGKRM